MLKKNLFENCKFALTSVEKFTNLKKKVYSYIFFFKMIMMKRNIFSKNIAKLFQLLTKTS